MRIDIRDGGYTEVTEIVYTGGSFLKRQTTKTLFIVDSACDEVEVEFKVIDDLILALKAAKDLWGKEDTSD